MNKISATKNYALLIVGIIFFPLIIFSTIISKKQRKVDSGWDKSHFEAQYVSGITIIITYISIFTSALLTITFIPKNSHPSDLIEILLLTLNYTGYVAAIWVLSRCIRGIFLAGGQKEISNPKSYTIWHSEKSIDR